MVLLLSISHTNANCYTNQYCYSYSNWNRRCNIQFTYPWGTHVYYCSSCSSGKNSPGCSGTQCSAGSSLCQSPGPSSCNAGKCLSGSSCVNCASGKYKSGSQTSCNYCSTCPSGKTSPSGSNAQSDCYPTTCPVGQYSDGSNCVNCAAGKYKHDEWALQSHCYNCDTGKTSPSGSTSSSNCYINQCSAGTYLSGQSCVNCAAGAYKTNTATGQWNCQACPSGTTSTPGSTAQSNCFSCPAGTTLNVAGDACTSCAAGTYKHDTTVNPCTSCGSNAASNPSSDNIDDCSCNAGYYGEFGESSAQLVSSFAGCQAQHPPLSDFSSSDDCQNILTTLGASMYVFSTCNDGLPLACSAMQVSSTTTYGYWNPSGCTGRNCGFSEYGSQYQCVCQAASSFSNECTQCPTDTTSPAGSTDSSACLVTTCAVGTTSNAEGNACTPCASGTYKDDTTVNPCTSCVSNTHSNAAKTACVADAGYIYETYYNAVIQCHGGTYSPAGATVCTTCPTHSTSTGGSDEITDCTANAGYYALSDVVAGGSTNVLQVFSDVEYLLACDNGKQLIPNGDSQGGTISFPSTSGVVLTSHLGNGLSNARTSCNADALCIGIYWRSSTQNVPGYPQSCNFPGCTTQQTVYTYYYYTANTLDGMAPVQNWESTYCVYESGYSNWKVYAKRENIVPVMTSCPTHSTSLAGATSLSDCLCNAGYELVGDTCTPCESGKYKGYGMSNDACVACTSTMAYSSSEGVGNTYCECQQGYTLVGEECVICTSGDVQYYKPSLGNESCTACLSNHAISPGIIPYSVEECKCIPGYFSASDSGSASCIPCEIGSYRQGLENGVACTSCNTGGTTIASGASDNTYCIPDAGYYQIDIDSFSQCPENTYRLYDNTGSNSYDISTCTPCPHLSSSEIGSTSLTDCTCSHALVEGSAGTPCECVAGFYEFEESCAEQCSDDPVVGWYKLPGHLRTDTEDSTLQSTTLQQCAQYANNNNFEQIEFSNDASCKLWSDISLTTAVTPVVTAVKCHCPVRPDLPSMHTCRTCPTDFFCPAAHNIVACPWYSTTIQESILPIGTNLARACGVGLDEACTVFASSTSGNSVGGRMVDGNNNWGDDASNWHSSGLGKQWARIDLGQMMYVSYLHVYNRQTHNNGRLHQSYLRTSSTAYSNWDDIHANADLCGQLTRSMH